MERKMVNFIKEQYPPGTRIRLNAMDDPYAPILPGTEGEVDFVDDAGQHGADLPDPACQCGAPVRVLGQQVNGYIQHLRPVFQQPLGDLLPLRDLDGQSRGPTTSRIDSGVVHMALSLIHI